MVIAVGQISNELITVKGNKSSFVSQGLIKSRLVETFSSDKLHGKTFFCRLSVNSMTRRVKTRTPL
jgi:hypothetical protein